MVSQGSLNGVHDLFLAWVGWNLCPWSIRLAGWNILRHVKFFQGIILQYMAKMVLLRKALAKPATLIIGCHIHLFSPQNERFQRNLLETTENGQGLLTEVDSWASWFKAIIRIVPDDKTLFFEMEVPEIRTTQRKCLRKSVQEYLYDKFQKLCRFAD